jgi:hypothetical protein
MVLLLRNVYLITVESIEINFKWQEIGLFFFHGSLKKPHLML